MSSKDHAYLRQVSIFGDLSEEELTKLNEIVINRNYRKGMIIFMEGEYGNGLYIVKEGRVKLSKTLADGREQILHFVKKGEVFAEILLFDGGEFPATAETQEDGEIGLIRNSDLDRLLEDYPTIAVKLLKVMSKRLRRAQQQIRDLALKDSYGRMASTLLKLAQEHGREEGDHLLIDFSLSQQDLANMIGSSRETVARITSDFRKQKLISVEKQKIIILNRESLQDWSDR